MWRWEAAPFGDTPANEQPTGGLTRVSYSLRLPGQQYDTETGLHYNYFRDYEAGIGRYAQSDPIGLMGSIDGYTYVDAMPLYYSDPWGLAKSTPSRDVCGCTVLGKGQKTGGRRHARRSEQIAQLMACSGEYIRVGINIAIRTLIGRSDDPRYQPDVSGERHDGSIDVVEVPSPSDKEDKLRTRAERGQGNLGSGSKPGKIRITPKCRRSMGKC